MDRRRRSLLVQFWLTVESFKNPLESVDSGTSGDEDDPVQDAATSATAKEDISMINDLYFSGPTINPALATISTKHVDIIREFARNKSAPSSTAQRRVRRSVMLAQMQVERAMEQDYEEFERSELWFRAIGDTEFRSKPSPTDSFARKHERSLTSHQTKADSLSTSMTVATGHGLPSSSRQGGHTGYTMQRTASSNSNHSSHSLASAPLRAQPSNIEVLMSPIMDMSTEPSRAPLFDDPEDALQRAEEQRMEAIHAALTDIMALEQQQKEQPSTIEESGGAAKSSKTVFGPDGQTRRAVFEDEHDDDVDDADDLGTEGSGDAQTSYQLAAPGDLQLSYEIARLGDNITNLQAQDVMLDNLIKKAELTGDLQESKLLTKSKSSVNRELRELRFQKLQYEQQESANRLFSDRTKVLIVNSTAGDEDGKSVVRYLIEVQQLAQDGCFASGWVVARRYNEFLSMHNKLRERYALVRQLDFPGKRLVTALSGSFVDTRKAALEKYLQVSATLPTPCTNAHQNPRTSLPYQSFVRAMNSEHSFHENLPSLLLAATKRDRRSPCPFPGLTLFGQSIGQSQKVSTTCSSDSLCSMS